MFRATIVTMNAIKPGQSNDFRAVDGALLSGVPRSSKKLTIATAIDIQKIHRHPIVEATKPPNSGLNPDPPHDPIDQKLSAR
jgi:hypothetical protein